jgi:hypothetical protein
MDELINLVCVKDKGKLRVRITSPGYKKESNCQFPRNLRVEGRKFTVHKSDITLAKIGQCYFYRIRANTVKIRTNITETDKNNLKVFGEEDKTECTVCMDSIKDAVFGPCGHYSCCKKCALTIESSAGTCPMCRTVINFVIDYSELK